jgi:hypothetical protein
LRNSTAVVKASKTGVPKSFFKPRNCHEAVLGWVLYAKYPERRDIIPEIESTEEKIAKAGEK